MTGWRRFHLLASTSYVALMVYYGREKPREFLNPTAQTSSQPSSSQVPS